MTKDHEGAANSISTRSKKRFYGDRIAFKSLSCAPVNELGVVYLFGVLHDVFDFKIESIQAGYPDCLARRKVGLNRWEEVRIEFEYESQSFLTHGHDPEGVDVIVCWRDNWAERPKHIEIIALSSLLDEIDDIGTEIKTKRQLSAWQRFCQEKRLQGLDFPEIAKLWKKKKDNLR